MSAQASIPVRSVWLVTFGMYGALFVLTQYLQFSLGYTALQTGSGCCPPQPRWRWSRRLLRSWSG